jgi:isopentenyl phosphate kinase
MNDLLFLKLGGSLITDKTGVAAVRPEVLARLAREIQQARLGRPAMRLLIGHGSGSFGHVAAAHYGTRQGIGLHHDMPIVEQWHGFAQVSAAAAHLNKYVTEALLAAGVPALSLQPSASAICQDGRIATLAVTPIRLALAAGLVPVVYGDVAFDTVRGGAIISTEEILVFLLSQSQLELRPSWLLLAGETDGVLDLAGESVPVITPANLADVAAALGGSHGKDVTGGMASKVRQMLDLVAAYPHLAIRIFSGLPAGEVERALLQPEAAGGTLLIRQ